MFSVADSFSRGRQRQPSHHSGRHSRAVHRLHRRRVRVHTVQPQQVRLELARDGHVALAAVVAVCGSNSPSDLVSSFCAV